MTKFELLCTKFCSLSEEKQEYILGMIQALAFAKDQIEHSQLEEVDDDKNEGIWT
jgi:hypothetical protein